jgi:hypothetical protein
MKDLDKQTARRIIAHLKAGTTPIDCVKYLNVGNERWYDAAAKYFDDIGADSDSLVRFIKGYYGDGKTHFLGMLRSIAFDKGWLVTYVTAESTPLHKFDIVYSELVKNLALPPRVWVPEWLAERSPKGAAALLSYLFATFYYEAYRLPDRSGLQKERVISSLRQKVNTLATDPYLHEAIGVAVRAYVEATIRGDSAGAHLVCAWLEGADVRHLNSALPRRVDQKLARDATRSISVVARRAGAGGVLVLLDEAELIMGQSAPVRKKSYGVIRDLLDNTDGQGMRSSIIYIAATPEMFQEGKGFPEYDALRSRLANVPKFTVPGLADWRGIVVDLTKTAMSRELLVRLVNRIVDLHSIACEWKPKEYISEEVILQLVTEVTNGASVVSVPRLLTSSAATLLELVEQNRDQLGTDLVRDTLQAVRASLVGKTSAKQWT